MNKKDEFLTKLAALMREYDVDIYAREAEIEITGDTETSKHSIYSWFEGYIDASTVESRIGK